jgi:isopentenyl-diphosphate delta-isomerase
MEYVVLVDKNDVAIGEMEKLSAHQNGGVLHRAVSVFIYNERGELLLQKRASGKYHSANLWTNTCCGHPRPGEETANAAARRLKEEMGMSAVLQLAFTFEYKATLQNGLTEYEIDHVYTGVTNNKPCLNTEETSEYRYIDPNQLEEEIKVSPELFTEWFKICLRDWRHKLLQVGKHIEKKD